MSWLFYSDESRAKKFQVVAFIEEGRKFRLPKQDTIEVRLKVPRICYADYGTGKVEDCKPSPRLRKCQGMSLKTHSGASGRHFSIISLSFSVFENLKAGVVKLQENGFGINDFVEKRIKKLT